MNKAFDNFMWEDWPKTDTPLGKRLLNKVNAALNETENRVITLDTTKLDKSDAQMLIQSITFNRSNGVFTITYFNGTEATIDTMLEKLAVNFDFDETTQQMIITLDDGTVKRVDLSAFIVPLEFIDSDTVVWQLLDTGKVKAIVKEGSIEEKHLRPDYLAEITVEAGKAQASASAAESSANASIASANAAELSANSAQTSETNAARSAHTATQKSTEAELSAASAAASALNASDSAAAATGKANEAETSAANAANSERTALSNANAASESAASASECAANAVSYAKKSQSYAVGGTGTRENEDSDNAKYYYEQAKHISQGANGLIPMGTVSFSDLPATDISTNAMYNISDDFFSDERFLDGGGIFYGRGSNVYYTIDGKWDVLASSSVTGVKGEVETSYRQGNVNITPANIGAVSTAYMNEHFTADYVSTSRASVSKAGWYRIAKYIGEDGVNSCVVSLKRTYYNSGPEFQKIQFFGTYRSKKFVSIAAYTGQYGVHMWTKIRHVRETPSTGQIASEYIEVYYNGEGKDNIWLISIEDALGVYSNNWKTITPERTEESVENVQVYATLDLPANFDTRDLLTKNGSISCVGRDTYLAYPEGGNLDSGVSSLTGYLKITLPVTWSQTMLGFTVTIYDYLTHSSVDYHIFGYNYVQSTGWISPTAVCVGRADGRHSNLTVRFGHDGSKCAITIGEANTAWSYPKVQVHDVLLGHYGNFSQWKSGWNVAVSTAELSTITASVTNTHVAYGGTASRISAGPGTANFDRHVWFSSNTQEMERDYNDRFMFNPYTQTLKVQNLQGNAASATKATQDSDGNVIKDTYAKRDIYKDSYINFRDQEIYINANSCAIAGSQTYASGEYSCVIGGCSDGVLGENSCVLGGFENYSYSSNSCICGGEYNIVRANDSCAAGEDNYAENHASFVAGKYNKKMVAGGTSSNQIGDVFVIGNGTSDKNRSNAFRVTYGGRVYGVGAFNTSGADYAEYFQYKDGNPENEDRVGYFMTVEEGLIKKADAGDYILGIVSGNPSIIGNADEDYYWRYERDEFNRIVMEDVPETIQKIDENGNLEFDEETHKPILVETGNMIKNARMRLAEGYDPTLQETYVERKDRKEWACVGMLGVLPVRDDGTCIPGKFCKCGAGGIATLAENRDFDTFFVIERKTDNIVSVILK